MYRFQTDKISAVGRRGQTDKTSSAMKRMDKKSLAGKGKDKNIFGSKNERQANHFRRDEGKTKIS